MPATCPQRQSTLLKRTRWTTAAHVDSGVAAARCSQCCSVRKAVTGERNVRATRRPPTPAAHRYKRHAWRFPTRSTTFSAKAILNSNIKIHSTSEIMQDQKQILNFLNDNKNFETYFSWRQPAKKFFFLGEPGTEDGGGAPGTAVTGTALRGAPAPTARSPQSNASGRNRAFSRASFNERGEPPVAATLRGAPTPFP